LSAALRGKWSAVIDAVFSHIRAASFAGASSYRDKSSKKIT
jgi:hypothetical protein